MKYGEDYQIPEILDGRLSPEKLKEKQKMAGGGAFEERFAVVNLIHGTLKETVGKYGHADRQLTVMYELLQHMKKQKSRGSGEQGADQCRSFLTGRICAGAGEQPAGSDKDGTAFPERTEISGDCDL